MFHRQRSLSISRGPMKRSNKLSKLSQISCIFEEKRENQRRKRTNARKKQDKTTDRLNRAVLQQQQQQQQQSPRVEVTSSDVALIRSIRPRRSRELVLGRAHQRAPRHGRVARKRSLCAIAIVFASLFHYDGVWRVPYPIRPDCQRILPSSLCSPARFKQRLLSSPLPLSLSLSLSLLNLERSFSLDRVRSSFSFSCSSLETISDDAFHDDACSLLFQRNMLRASFVLFVLSFVPRFQPSTRTHRRDDDVRDITPAGERGSPMEQRWKERDGRRGKERKAR